MRGKLVQILLPLYDNEGKMFSRKDYEQVRTELMKKFTGLTAYVRSPATGLWKTKRNTTIRDQMILYEVVVRKFDRNWWNNYRKKLIKRFLQESILIRISDVEVL